MNKKLKSYSPSKDAQLTITEQISGVVLPIPIKAHENLYTKSDNNKVIKKILEQVYVRGLLAADENSKQTPQQQAFGRVNSFLNYGKAYELDMDLLEEIMENPLDCKNGGNLIEDQCQMSMLRAKQKGRKTPNLADNIYGEDCGNKKSRTTSIIKSIVKRANRGL